MELLLNKYAKHSKMFYWADLWWFYFFYCFQAPEGCHPAHSRSAGAQHHQFLFLVFLVAGKSFSIISWLLKSVILFLFAPLVFCLFFWWNGCTLWRFLLGSGPCSVPALGELPGSLVHGRKPVCTGRSEREEAEKTGAQTDEEVLMLRSTWGSIFIHRIKHAICEELLINSERTIKLCHYEMLLNLIQFLYCWKLFSVFAFLLLSPLIKL